MAKQINLKGDVYKRQYLISRNGSFLTHADRDKIMNENIFSEAFATENHSQEQIGREMLAGHTGTIRFDNQ